MWMLTPQNYERIRRWFPPDSRRFALLRFFYSFVTVPVYFAYPALLALLWQAGDARRWRVLLAPAATFVLCTLLRAWLHAPRPYQQPGFTPLLPRTPAKGGQTPAEAPDDDSCPSRHAASAAIVALAGWYISPPLGGALSVLCVLIALVRVLAGVHHPRDVVAGMLLAAVVGGIGFWVV